MKWLFLTVSVVVAGALAGFAIYTFGWREPATTTNAGTEAGRTSLSSRQQARLNHAVNELIRARSDWATSGATPRVAAEEACGDLVILIRENPGVPAVISAGDQVIDFIGDAPPLTPCRNRISQAIRDAL